MNWFERFFGDYFKRGSYSTHYDELGAKEAKYIDLSNLHNVYHSIPHLRCVIDRRAEMLSNGIFKVLDSKGNEIENHKALELLKSPNVMQSAKEFLMCLSINYDLYGNAFTYKNETIRKNVKSLWVLPSGEIKIHTTGKVFNQLSQEDIISKITLVDEEIDIKDVIRFKAQDNNIVVGNSKVNTLKQQISNIRYAYDSRNILLNERGAIGILSVKSGIGKNGIQTNPMKPTEKKAAEEKLTKDYGIQKGQRRINVTTLDVNWQPMTFPTADLMLFEEISDDFEVILDTYGLNTHIFSKDSKYDNQDGALKRVYQDTIIPHAEFIADKLGKGIGLKPSEKLVLSFDHLPIMQEDEKYKAETFKINVEAVKIAVESGLMTKEEGAEKIKNG